MSVLSELRKQWEATRETADEIADKVDTEKRGMTEEEQKKFDALMTEHERLEGEIGRRERLEKAHEAAKQGDRRSDPQKPETPESLASKIEFKNRIPKGSLRSFKGPQAEQHAFESGMWIRGFLFNDQKSREWCREHGVVTRAMSEANVTAGGYLVPDQLEQTIIDLREQHGVFRQNTKVIPMSSDHVIVPRRTGGLDAYAIGENTEIVASDKSWDNVALTARKWGVLAKMSSELADDAVINLADDLAGEIAYAFALKEDQMAINGDGTATYHGTVGIRTKMIDGNHAGSYYTAAGAAGECDVWAEIGEDDITGVMAMLPGYALSRNPKWYCPVGAVAAVFGRLMRAGSGNTVADLSNGFPTKYCGYDIVPVAAWADTAATDYSGTIALLFGDLSLAATLGDRRGTAIRVSTERFLEYDQIAVVGTTRFDINVHDIGGASAAGPLVGLLGV